VLRRAHAEGRIVDLERCRAALAASRPTDDAALVTRRGVLGALLDPR